MKTRLLMLPAALVLAAGMAFTSCSDDDEDYKTLTLFSEYDFDCEKDLLDLCDVTIEYMDFDGNVRKETVKAPDYHVQLKATTFPVASYYNVTITPKEHQELTKASYDLDCEIDYEAYYRLGTAKIYVVPEKDIVLCNDNRVSPDAVEYMLGKISDGASAVNLHYSFFQDGGAVKATLNELP